MSLLLAVRSVFFIDSELASFLIFKRLHVTVIIKILGIILFDQMSAQHQKAPTKREGFCKFCLKVEPNLLFYDAD